MERSYDINVKTYQRCVRMFGRVKKHLGINIKMHTDSEQIKQGHIFLFNHFSRVETFMPQFFIYEESGAYCRSIAAASFFARDNHFSNLLSSLGVVPNNHPQLMALLAQDILKGRKIIVFPEGGMVKDRKVLTDDGEYRVYSRKNDEHRKLHTGAARLAYGLFIFKAAVRKKLKQENYSTLTRWADELGFDTLDELEAAALLPTNIVPANITFYPLRVNENLLSKGVDYFYKGLSERVIEELIIEGNLLLKKTDMDIRCGESFSVDEGMQWHDRLFAHYFSHDLQDLNSIYDNEYVNSSLAKRWATLGIKRSVNNIRDYYMQAIYSAVTINLSHIVSVIIFQLLKQHYGDIELRKLKQIIYVTIKKLQEYDDVHLHRSLKIPDRYEYLLTKENKDLDDYINNAKQAELLRINNNKLIFLPKLEQETGFDRIRLDNPISVYVNEAEPIGLVAETVTHVLKSINITHPAKIANLRFNDELLKYEFDKQRFNRDKHSEINAQETMTLDPRPFYLHENTKHDTAILLVHGLFSTPAAVRELADEFYSLGYPVLGTRLYGHGTSPWDLRQTVWQDWLQAIQHGYDILATSYKKICIVGFSTGAALSYLFAAKQPQKLGALVSVCCPLKFINTNIHFAPIVYRANKMVQWFSSSEGVMPFRKSDSEFPETNYRHIPVSTLYQLGNLINELQKALPSVNCPVCLLQSNQDPVVNPKSVEIIYNKLKTEHKELIWIESDRHGILQADVDNCRKKVIDYVVNLEKATDTVEIKQVAAL